MPDGFASAAALLPQELANMALALPAALRRRTEEFRLRLGQLPTLLLPEGERPLAEAPVDRRTLQTVLEKATRASLHAHGDALRRGYLAAPGGVRVGVCGTAVTEQGIRTLRDFSSLSLRVPRELPGVGAAAAEAVLERSVLIVSPPGGGKTSFLRELVRLASTRGRRVSLCDERGELAGVWEGRPQFQLGPCTDVLSGADKAEAALVLLRAMNPEIVAMDELASPEDAQAVEALSGCGVRVFATAHGDGLASLRRRPALRRLLEAGVFESCVLISGKGEGRAYAVETL